MSESSQSRPFIGVHFACAVCYGRFYRNKEKTAYTGNCPRCGQFFKADIGPEGTEKRTFTVNCGKRHMNY